MDRPPLTSSDLRAIADALDTLEESPALIAHQMIGAIDVHLDGEDDPVGQFVAEGSGNELWYGFRAGTAR